MKKLRYIRWAVAAFAALQITACDVEPIDPAVLTDNPVTEVPVTENPDDQVPSAGDYWPTALNNKWVYSENGETAEMKMVSINSIDGNTYYTFDTLFGMDLSGMGASVTTRIRKTGGNYYVRMEDITITGGGMIPGMTLSGHEYILFKDNLEVNETWTQSYQQVATYTGGVLPNVTTQHNLTGKIHEKGGSIQVQGVVYNDVIKSTMTEVISGANMPTETTTTTYWFAKGIGPVKVQMVDSDGNTTTELVSYQLN